jgi:hypothetical protein
MSLRIIITLCLMITFKSGHILSYSYAHRSKFSGLKSILKSKYSTFQSIEHQVVNNLRQAVTSGSTLVENKQMQLMHRILIN